jgi:hypothetical protein
MKTIKCYSQFNEDEVIARLLQDVGEGDKVCVDIGAKSTINSNVARLIIHHGWRGFLFDRGLNAYRDCVRTFGPFDDNEIPRDACPHCGGQKAWPVCMIKTIVKPDNVNRLLPNAFDLLSIDIDGQDYYIWEAIVVEPRIVIIEYNARLSDNQVMRKRDGYEHDKDPNNRKSGASEDAMVDLGKRKGYRLADKNHVNLFFVRKDLVGDE